MDQIFTQRNIIELAIERKSPLYMNFSDFKKAFDSIPRGTLWKIVKAYGVPDKTDNIVTLMKCFYTKFECAVLFNNKETDWFTVNSGVREGCIISLILFLIDIDWVIKKTTVSKRGNTWSIFTTLHDLDFADDHLGTVICKKRLKATLQAN